MTDITIQHLKDQIADQEERLTASKKRLASLEESVSRERGYVETSEAIIRSHKDALIKLGAHR